MLNDFKQQRIPAAHMGLYGLKGSVARMPHAGLMGSHDGMDAIIGNNVMINMLDYGH